MADPIPSWRGLSIRRSHLGTAASMTVKGFGRLPKDWLISHSRLPHCAASSGVVVNHLPSKLPTVGRNIPDFTMSSTSSGLTARYKRTHSSSAPRAACPTPRVSAAPPPARSSAALSIPTPNPPSARGSRRNPQSPAQSGQQQLGLLNCLLGWTPPYHRWSLTAAHAMPQMVYNPVGGAPCKGDSSL
jgi:hypothetical protein